VLFFPGSCKLCNPIYFKPGRNAVKLFQLLIL
jgi:hypothetical protein